MSAEANILVCFALREEAGVFQQYARVRSDVVVLITGIGRRNTGVAFSAALKDVAPRLVFTCGFAGALNLELGTGDVVFSTCDAELRQHLLAAGAKAATFYCAPKIATTAAEKQELRRVTGSDAVEMESEVIQNICRERGITCVTVRVISDTADEDLPLDFNKLSKPDLSLDYVKLALAIAKSPGKIPALIRLQGKCKFAAERLAGVLEKVLAQH